MEAQKSGVTIATSQSDLISCYGQQGSFHGVIIAFHIGQSAAALPVPCTYWRSRCALYKAMVVDMWLLISRM